LKRNAKPRSFEQKGDAIPPGATKKASDAQLPRNAASDLGDPHAAGTPGGGTEVGGLAGTNVGDGAPENADLERAFGDPRGDEPLPDPDTPYGGISGGAVGGTPAGKRSKE
jgi:hypothetical protein